MELPFAALQHLCSPLLDRLDVLPEPQRDALSTAVGLAAGGPPERLLIGLAILNLLATAAESGPVLCVIDDVHWFDRASTETFTFVARRLLAESVALVFATRHPIPGLSEFPELLVEGLRERDAQELLATVVHVAVDERVRDRIVAETRGNPLALIELPRGRSPAELAGGFDMPSVLPMSGQIEESFRRRIAELPVPTQAFLTVAAADPTGDPVIVWRAAGALGISPSDVSPAIDAGLIEIGFRVSFRHPLVRAAAYGIASESDRQAAHRELARATDPDLDPDRYAWHCALGSAGPDEDIAQALERSATRARVRGGVAAAGALLERSVALTIDPTRRTQRILAAAAAHLEAGSFDVAAALLAMGEASDLDEMSRAHVELMWARHGTFGGDIRDSPARLLDAARRLETLDPDLAAIVYTQAMATAAVVGDLGRDPDLATVCAAAMACPLPPARTLKEWILVGLATFTVDGPAVAAPALRHALSATDDESLVDEAVQWQGQLLGVAMLAWDIESLRRLTVVNVRRSRELGALTMLPVALQALAQVHMLDGELDSAASAITEASHILEATGSRFFSPMVATVAALVGADDALAVINDQIAAAHEARIGISVAAALWAHATLCNSAGEYEQAFALAANAAETSWEWNAHVYLPELIEAAVRTGRRAEAEAAFERLRQTTDPAGTDWAVGIQCRSEALLADGDAAEVAYRAAIDHLARSGVRSELARAHLLYGEWLRRENRRVDARAQLRTAHEMFDGMGMAGFSERARRELVATGETVHKRSDGTLDELTPQEALVARLAADGRTNAEIGTQLFISPRTVEWHLRKVFTKLGVTSRRDLREILPVPG
jgi:DNA-binding CsgD family transcriptional regulator/tetratricopeptide (TPR) repeat protein